MPPAVQSFNWNAVMARSEEESVHDEVDSLQDRVIRELDVLNERIEAVIGDFVRPRLDDESEESERATDTPPEFRRKAA